MTDKVIKVNVTATKKQSVNISAGNVQNQITATPDSTQYYSKLSKNWAIGEGLIQNIDYSSKTYAEQAKIDANNAKFFSETAQNTYTNVQEEAQSAITNINTSKEAAISAVNTAKDNAVNTVNATASSFANRDLSNLSSVGEKHFLNKQQITNCLLEVPQRINLTLSDGTLTLKKGSVVTVPYGTTNRTSEFPVGSQFLNSNWKVVDTQFADNKFFVWAELQSDLSNNRTDIDGKDRFISVYLDGVINGATSSQSGTSFSNGLGYNTSENTVYWYNTSGVAQGTQLAFPIGIVACGDTYTFGSIKQVFNGFGYIGGTFWCDKGVKGLIPNGRNDDGTLKNTELTTSKFNLTTLSTYTTSGMVARVALNGNVGWSDRLYIQEENPNKTYSHWYQPSTNTLYYANATAGDYTKTEQLIFAFFDRVSGKITGWRPKQAFRALSYDDIKINNPYFFGQYIWSEFAPNNLSWLKSSGQWNSGGGYPTFYDWVLTNANAGTSGFKKSTASYTDYDFVVNTSAKTFRLPIKVKGRMGEAVVGNGKAMGLTQGSSVYYLGGNASSSEEFGGNNSLSSPPSVGTSGYGSSNIADDVYYGLAIDPTKSGIVLDTTGLSLYFYVGETTRDTGLVNAAMALEALSNKVEVVEAYLNGTSGYRVYSADSTGKRYCEQWGLGAITTANSNTIALLKSFGNTNYNVISTVVGTNERGYAITCSSKANDSFVIKGGYCTNTGISNTFTGDARIGWRACGYIS